MNADDWTEFLNSSYEAVYALLLDEARCGPFDGGCVLVA